MGREAIDNDRGRYLWTSHIYYHLSFFLLIIFSSFFFFLSHLSNPITPCKPQPRRLQPKIPGEIGALAIDLKARSLDPCTPLANRMPRLTPVLRRSNTFFVFPATQPFLHSSSCRRRDEWADRHQKAHSGGPRPGVCSFLSYTYTEAMG